MNEAFEKNEQPERKRAYPCDTEIPKRQYPCDEPAAKRRSYPCDAEPVKRSYPCDTEAENKEEISSVRAADSAKPAPAGKGRRGGNSAMSVVIQGKKRTAAGRYEKLVRSGTAEGRKTGAGTGFGQAEPEGIEDFSRAQPLKVLQNTDIGSFLELPDGNKVLLPFAEQTETPEVGAHIPVYLYKDKGGRLTCTMRKPILGVGEVGVLKIAEITRIGAFLDNGVPKQVLLPFKEQICMPKEGSEALVYIYNDKTGRQAATMRVYKHLSNRAPYQADDRVQGFVYEINPDIGIFVAVDNKYFGLIPKAEVFEQYRYGQTVACRVLKVREDGKLDLSAREKAYIAIEKDAEAILAELRKNGGRLPYADRADAKQIEEVYHMSKNQFKRALGSLYKQRKVAIDREADSVTLLSE